MFGFGDKKKKYLSELIDIFSDLGHVERDVAQSFVRDYEKWIISETLDRHLDPFLGAYNISEKSMERIVIAHKLKRYDEAKLVPDFMLLVSYRANNILESMPNNQGATFASSSLMHAVTELPVNIEVPDVTYLTLLKKLDDEREDC
jgi:hypothetical protein